MAHGKRAQIKVLRCREYWGRRPLKRSERQMEKREADAAKRLVVCGRDIEAAGY